MLIFDGHVQLISPVPVLKNEDCEDAQPWIQFLNVERLYVETLVCTI